MHNTQLVIFHSTLHFWRNTQDHDPFHVERYINGVGFAPSVERIRNNSTRSRRNFAVDTLKLAGIDCEVIEIGIDLSSIIYRNYADYDKSVEYNRCEWLTNIVAGESDVAGAGSASKGIRTTGATCSPDSWRGRSNYWTVSMHHMAQWSSDKPESAVANAVANETYPAWIWALYSALLITWPMTATSRSHSPSIPIPSINFCNLLLAPDLGFWRWHSLTRTVDTKMRGPLPPMAWR